MHAELSGRSSTPASTASTLPEPSLTRVELANGLHVLVQSDYAAPVVSLQYWCGTGSIHEGQWLGAGISHLLEHLMFKGTPTRGNSAMAQQIQALGGHLNAYTSFDRTVYHADLPSDHWKMALEILTDAMLNSTIPEEEYAKEQEVIRREFAMGEDNPDRQLTHLLFRTAFVQHPYRFPVIGYLDLFNRVRRDDVWEYYRTRYTPQNMTLIVCGAVDGETVVAASRELLEAIPRRPLPDICLPSEPRQLSRREAVKAFPTEITRLTAVVQIPGLDHPDIPALEILAMILGGGRSARLHQICVEQVGLAEEVDAFAFAPSHIGLWGVDARCLPANADKLMTRVDDELKRIRQEAVAADELTRAKRLSLLQQVNAMKTMSGQASSIGRGWLLARDPHFSRHFLEQLTQVTPADIQRVAQTYLKPEAESVIRVVPEKKGTTSATVSATAPELEKPVLTYTPSGIRVLQHLTPRLPLVSFRAILSGGYLSEPAGKNGLSRLASQLLLKGTRHRSAANLADAIEQLGGVIGADSGNNSASLMIEMLKDDWKSGLDLFLEVLREPDFVPNEFEIEKRKQLAAWQVEQDQPMAVARNLLRQTLYAGHPYANSLLGSPESMEKITPDDVVNHIRKVTAPEKLLLALAGDLPPDLWPEKLNAAFPDVSQPTRFAPPLEAPKLAASSRVEHVLPKEQAILQIAYSTVPLTHPDRLALEILDEALSDLGSRLFIRIREELGLAYFVGTSQFFGLAGGHFVFYVGTDPKKRLMVETVLQEEIDRLAVSGISAQEFERARAKLESEQKLESQNASYVAYSAALDEFYGLGYNFGTERQEALRKITLAQINAVSMSYFNNTPHATVVVSPE